MENWKDYGSASQEKDVCDLFDSKHGKYKEMEKSEDMLPLKELPEGPAPSPYKK